MVHNDDEPILKQSTTDGGAYFELDDGLVEERIFNKPEAPMEESPFKVLLEVNGVGSGEGRLGLDLVTILDIGSSMKGLKIAKTKLAVLFLLQKLSPLDRLSIVTLNKEAHKLCPLRQITQSSKEEIVTQVNALEVGSSTNLAAGLKMALEILNGRNLTKRRRVAIMVISDGIEDGNSDAASVPVGTVPVYVFGVGNDCNQKVLKVIAEKSNRGMFAVVPLLDPWRTVFSKSMQSLLDVVMEDLTLTITPENGSKIAEVNSLNYHQLTTGSEADPVTVSFGSLCNRETCKVLFKLTLPEVKESGDINIFKVCYKFRVEGEETLKSVERIIHVVRNAHSRVEQNEEVPAEERRIEFIKQTG